MRIYLFIRTPLATLLLGVLVTQFLTGCITPFSPYYGCLVERGDVLLGASPQNEVIQKLAQGLVSEQDQVAWFRSKDAQTYKMCVVGSEIIFYGDMSCPSRREVHVFEEVEFRDSNGQVSVEWRDITALLECVVIT